MKVIPGVRLNLGKTGVSVSFKLGPFTKTFGPSGTRTTMGIPGTGVSYTELAKKLPRTI